MLEPLVSGMTMEEILKDYSDFEKKDLLACIQYAAKLMKIKSLYKSNS